MTSDALAVRYSMTLDDLVDGNRFAQRSFRRFVTVTGVIAGLAGAALLVISPTWLGLLLIGYGLLDLALLWFRPIERALIRRRVAAMVGKECEAAVRDDGLAYVDGDSRGTFAWADLTDIREDARTLAVSSGGLMRLGVPKRAFESEAHLASFREAIAERIGTAARVA